MSERLSDEDVTTVRGAQSGGVGEAPVPRDETPAALRQLGRIGGLVLLLLALTYLTPMLHALRPWLPGEPVPVIHALLGEQEGGLPEFAGSGSGYQSGRQTEPDAPPVIDEEVDEAAVSEPDAGLKAVLSRVIEARAPLTLTEGGVLDPFFAKLADVARGHGVVRIAHYGDSSIATDLITSTVRRKLQRRFGDAGHGFTLIAKGYMPYLHRDIRVSASKQWALSELVRESLGSSGWYGYGGVRYAVSGFGAAATYATVPDGPVGREISRFQLFYQAHPRGGEVELRYGDGEKAIVETGASEGQEDRVYTLEVPRGSHEIRLRHAGKGALRLYGVVLENDGPGVVYDSLGLVGARAKRLLNFDEAHIWGQLDARGVDLVVLGFGGNEASDPLARIESYRDGHQEVIRRMRGQPARPCIVFAPLDQAHKDDRGRIRTMETVPRIVEGQRLAAEAEGCAFFDTFEAMGGAESMLRWYRKKPRLAFGDFRHATPAGYDHLGQLFSEALLAAFQDYVRRTTAPMSTPRATPVSEPPSSPPTSSFSEADG